MNELLKRKQKLLSEMEVMNRSENPDQGYIQERALEVATINGKIEALEEAEKSEEERSAKEAKELEERSKLGPQTVTEKPDGLDSKEYREAFNSYVRNNASPEQMKLLRSMNAGSDSKGGFTIPKDNGGKVFELEKDSSVMRKLGTTITLTHEREIPLQGVVPSAEYIAEGAPYPTGDAEFGAKTFKALKNGVIVPVSDELVDDEEFGLQGYLNRKMNDSFEELDEDKFINGAGEGSNQPRGVLLDAQVGKTAAASGVFTAQELLDLIFSLKSKYAKKGKMMMNRATMGVVRGLYIDSEKKFTLEQKNGQYIVEGFPVEEAEGMPDIAAGTTPIAIGNFAYYQIADRSKMKVKVLTDGANYGEKGLVGFRFTARNDAKLMVSEAVKVLKMAP